VHAELGTNAVGPNSRAARCRRPALRAGHGGSTRLQCQRNRLPLSPDVAGGAIPLSTSLLRPAAVIIPSSTRTQHRLYLDIVISGVVQAIAEIGADRLHGRTSGIGRGDRDDHRFLYRCPYVAQHTEIGQCQHGSSGSRTDFGNRARAGHHVASRMRSGQALHLGEKVAHRFV